MCALKGNQQNTDSSNFTFFAFLGVVMSRSSQFGAYRASISPDVPNDIPLCSKQLYRDLGAVKLKVPLGEFVVYS